MPSKSRTELYKRMASAVARLRFPKDTQVWNRYCKWERRQPANWR